MAYYDSEEIYDLEQEIVKFFKILTISELDVEKKEESK